MQLVHELSFERERTEQSYGWSVREASFISTLPTLIFTTAVPHGFVFGVFDLVYSFPSTRSKWEKELVRVVKTDMIGRDGSPVWTDMFGHSLHKSELPSPLPTLALLERGDNDQAGGASPPPRPTKILLCKSLGMALHGFISFIHFQAGGAAAGGVALAFGRFLRAGLSGRTWWARP